MRGLYKSLLYLDLIYKFSSLSNIYIILLLLFFLTKLMQFYWVKSFLKTLSSIWYVNEIISNECRGLFSPFLCFTYTDLFTRDLTLIHWAQKSQNGSSNDKVPFRLLLISHFYYRGLVEPRSCKSVSGQYNDDKVTKVANQSKRFQ